MHDQRAADIGAHRGQQDDKSGRARHTQAGFVCRDETRNPVDRVKNSVPDYRFRGRHVGLARFLACPPRHCGTNAGEAGSRRSPGECRGAVSGGAGRGNSGGDHRTPAAPLGYTGCGCGGDRGRDRCREGRSVIRPRGLDLRRRASKWRGGRSQPDRARALRQVGRARDPSRHRQPREARRQAGKSPLLFSSRRSRALRRRSGTMGCRAAASPPLLSPVLLSLWSARGAIRRAGRSVGCRRARR